MLITRGNRVILSLFCCCLVLIQTPADAHPDLVLQIEQLTQELAKSPENTGLLIKRGDLHRRHAGWAAAARDFAQVRAIQPDHSLIDWYEGRLLVESGRAVEGEPLLSRFLQSNSDHPGAYRTRAEAYWQLEKPMFAAQDYQNVIKYSDTPSPAIYRSLVLSLVAVGPQQASAAEETVSIALGRFPGEVALMGLAAELSLAQSNTKQFLVYMSELPPALTELPQWKFRKAIQVCLQGDREQAAKDFSEILEAHRETSGKNTGAWLFPRALLLTLESEPLPEKCRNAAWQQLTSQQP